MIKYYIFGYTVVHKGHVCQMGDGVASVELPCTAIEARGTIKTYINDSLLDSKYDLREINLTLLKEWNENE